MVQQHCKCDPAFLKEMSHQGKRSPTSCPPAPRASQRNRGVDPSETIVGVFWRPRVYHPVERPVYFGSRRGTRTVACCLAGLYSRGTSVRRHNVAEKPIRFGIKVAQMTGLYEGMRDAWLEADRLGFDTGWGHDHLLNQNGHTLPEEEGWTILAAL